MMPQTDHDLLITLAARLESHSTREGEVSRATLAEVSKMSAKLDTMRDTQQDQTRDIRDLKAWRRDDDLRIATLEQKVDTLQDEADRHKASAQAVREDSEKRAKQYAWIAVITSPIIAIIVPILFKALVSLVAGTP